MKILLDNGAYSLKNIGDVSMLEIAVARLRTAFPDAKLSIFTTSPKRLNEIFEDVTAIDPSGRALWFGQIFPRLKTKRKNVDLVKFEEKLRIKFPHIVRNLIKIKLILKKQPEDLNKFNLFIEAFLQADLVVATGGGYIADSFKGSAIPVLETLELAAQQNKKTAILGQGLGSIKDLVLFEQAKATLQRIDLIALREKENGIPLLDKVGTSGEKVIVTGDDAIGHWSLKR